MVKNKIFKLLQLIIFFEIIQTGIRDPQLSLASTTPTSETDVEYLKTKLKTYISSFENLTISIQSEDNNSHTTNIYFDSSNSPQVFEIGYSSQQIISKSHNSLQLDISLIDQNQSDVFFVIYNGLNDYLLQLINNYFDITNRQQTKHSDIKSSSQTYLIVSISVMVVFSLILTVLLGKTIFAKQLILSVFLEIPEKTAKYLYSKCENFLAQLGSGEEEEVHSEVDLFIEDKEQMDEGKTSLFGKRKKKFKNSDNGSIGFFIKMLVIAIFVEAYYVVNYILGGNQLQVVEDLLLEYNNTCFSLGYYSLVANSEKQLIYNNQWKILNSDPYTSVSNMLTVLYQIDSSIHEEHAKNTEAHQTKGDYLSQFESVMFKDACTILVEQQGVSQNVCEKFSNGIVQQGMIAVVIRYFQLLRYQFDKYEWMIKNPNSDYTFDFSATDPTWTVKTLSTNKQTNNLYNLLRTPDAYELKFELLFDDFKVQRVLFLTIFILLLITASLVCWLPFLSNLNKEIWSTKCLLSFIPVDEVNKIRAISNFIKDYILERRI